MKKIILLIVVILLALPMVFADTPIAAGSSACTINGLQVRASATANVPAGNTFRITEGHEFSKLYFDVQFDAFNALAPNATMVLDLYNYTSGLSHLAQNDGVVYSGAVRETPNGSMLRFNVTPPAGTIGVGFYAFGATWTGNDSTNFISICQNANNYSNGSTIYDLDGSTLTSNISANDVSFILTGVEGAPAPPVAVNFTITANAFFFGTTLSAFTATMDGINYSTSNGTLYTPYYTNHTTTENIIVYAENYNTRTYTAYNLTTSPLAAVLNYSYHLLNVTLNNTDGDTLQNFTITARSTNGLENFTKVAVGPVATINLSIGGIYNLTLDAAGNALDYKTYIDNGSYWQHTQYTLFPENSVYVYIRDEDTQALIASNTSILFNGNSSFTRYTSNGTWLERDLILGSWDLTFNVIDTNLGYGSRTYTITIGNRSTQNLNAYLATDVQTTIFTIRDKDSGGLIEGASVTMQRLINSSYTNIETKESDITGRTQFSYTPNILYRFVVTNEDYQQLVFTLNPILFSAYTIQLVKLETDTIAQALDRVFLTLSPTTYYSGNNSFVFLTQSAYGELENYGYTITLPNGSTQSGSGVNANGEQLGSVVNIQGASVGDSVRVDYFYKTSLEGYKNFTKFYGVVTNASANTILSQRDDPTFGLGLGERLLILTGLLVVLVGITALIGQILIGMGLSLFLMGFLVFVGFVPLWSVLISILIGLIVIASRAGGP